MSSRRLTQLVGGVIGFIVGVSAVIVAYLTRRMIAPARQALWTTPAEMGLDYETVQFPARDGVRLSGWFIPAHERTKRDGSTVVLVHDWGWNRLGDAAGSLLASVSANTPVELLRLAHFLHYEGLNVLMFDLRNHGESASQPPVTFGQQEADDLLGALAFLEARDDVDAGRIGVVGFSMGANTLLYALPRTDRIAAGIAVQPMDAAVFAHGYAGDLLGDTGAQVMLPLVETAYSAIGGIRLSAIQPSFAAAGASASPVLFVQSKQDRWGTREDTARLVSALPVSEGPLFVDGTHRYQGFQYLIENPRVVTTFFEPYL